MTLTSMRLAIAAVNAAPLLVVARPGTLVVQDAPVSPPVLVNANIAFGLAHPPVGIPLPSLRCHAHADRKGSEATPALPWRPGYDPGGDNLRPGLIDVHPRELGFPE